MDQRLSPEDEAQIQRQLTELRLEHRDLDAAIAVMSSAANADPMGLQRLKKRKLALKDRITKLEDKLLPDIIAYPHPPAENTAPCPPPARPYNPPPFPRGSD